MQYVAVFFFCYTIQLITIKLCTEFQNPKSRCCLEVFDGKNSSLERKKNRKMNKIKGLISNMWLLFCYKIQLITIKLCSKFQNPK